MSRNDIMPPKGPRMLTNVTSDGQARRNPPKKRSLQVVNEHFEADFNAAWAGAVVCQHSRQRGAALLMVLLCVALCAILLASIAREGRRDITRLSLIQTETQADFYAHGAEIIAIRGLTDAAVRQASLWWQTLAGKPLDYPTDEGHLRLVVQDLRTCFNVNALAGDNADLAIRQLRYWLAHQPQERLRGLSPDAFVARLSDWIDSNTQARDNSLDGADYARFDPPRTSADTWLRDASELNWLAPLDVSRAATLPQLCALPETTPWQLNLNSITLRQLPLLEALFEGQVPRGTLIRLINARPATGYHDLDAVRTQAGANSDWLETYANRLTLTPDYLSLDITLTIGSENFHFVRLLKAEGVSGWNPTAPAARVKVLQRRNGSNEAWMRETTPEENPS